MKKNIIFIVLLFILSISSIFLLDLLGFKCIYKELLNVYCAGCGGTRMIKSILKLDFYQAFRYNPLMFIYLVLFTPVIIYDVYKYIKSEKVIYPSKKVIIILFIVTIIYSILRNIPEFSFLTPTKIK